MTRRQAPRCSPEGSRRLCCWGAARAIFSPGNDEPGGKGDPTASHESRSQRNVTATRQVQGQARKSVHTSELGSGPVITRQGQGHTRSSWPGMGTAVFELETVTPLMWHREGLKDQSTA